MRYWKDYAIVARGLCTVDVKEDFLGIWVGSSMLVWNIFRLLLSIALFLTLPVSSFLLALVVQHTRKQHVIAGVKYEWDEDIVAKNKTL